MGSPDHPRLPLLHPTPTPKSRSSRCSGQDQPHSGHYRQGGAGTPPPTRELPDPNAGAPASSHCLCSHRADEETESLETAVSQRSEGACGRTQSCRFPKAFGVSSAPGCQHHCVTSPAREVTLPWGWSRALGEGPRQARPQVCALRYVGGPPRELGTPADLRDGLPQTQGTPHLCPGRPLPYLLHSRHSEPAGQMEHGEGGPQTDSNRCLEAVAWANDLSRLQRVGGGGRPGHKVAAGVSPTLRAGLGIGPRVTPPPWQHRAAAGLATVAWESCLPSPSPGREVLEAGAPREGPSNSISRHAEHRLRAGLSCTPAPGACGARGVRARRQLGGLCFRNWNPYEITAHNHGRGGATTANSRTFCLPNSNPLPVNRHRPSPGPHEPPPRPWMSPFRTFHTRGLTPRVAARVGFPRWAPRVRVRAPGGGDGCLAPARGGGPAACIRSLASDGCD